MKRLTGTGLVLSVTILVALAITASVPLLLVSYATSCTLAHPTGVGDGAAEIGSGSGGGQLRLGLTLSPCRKRKLLLLEQEKGKGEPEGQGNWALQQPMSYSDVRHAVVKAVKIEETDLAELRAASPEFDLSDPRLLQLLRVVKSFTQGWAPVREPGGGLRSAWSIRHLRGALNNTSLMACCAHFRVVDGQLFFRYGTFFMKKQYRLDRPNDAASFLQATLDRFRLRDLRLEFLYNTCSHALAREAMAEGARSNFLVWTPHVTEELDADLVVPDFLDLRPEYIQSRDEMEELRERGRKWEEKIPKAVFRGATTNFWLRLSNWVSNPRLRLHRMTDGLGSFLDARVTRWSHIADDVVRDLEESEGIRPGDRLNDTQKNDFKYELVVDGGIGGCRLCGVLLTQRAVILQDSPFIQFFYPLLKKGRHFMETHHHSFQDLPQVVRYMQAHDREMREMVERAHKEVGWTCTIHGRMLAFAVILVRYHSIQNPLFFTTGVSDKDSLELIRPPSPEQRCRFGPATQASLYKNLSGDPTKTCALRPEARVLDLPGCPSDCHDGLLEPDWRWLSAHHLDGVPGTDWWKTYIPQST